MLIDSEKEEIRMSDRIPRDRKPDTKEEVLFDYDLQQEQDRRRRSRFVGVAVFLDDEKQPKKKPKKSYQI